MCLVTCAVTSIVIVSDKSGIRIWNWQVWFVENNPAAVFQWVLEPQRVLSRVSWKWDFGQNGAKGKGYQRKRKKDVPWWNRIQDLQSRNSILTSFGRNQALYRLCKSCIIYWRMREVVLGWYCKKLIHKVQDDITYGWGMKRNFKVMKWLVVM